MIISFAILCKIAFNKYTVAIKALINTGANAYIIIKTNLMKAFRDKTGIPRNNIKKIRLDGFNKKKSQEINKVTWAYLYINGYRDK